MTEPDACARSELRKFLQNQFSFFVENVRFVIFHPKLAQPPPPVSKCVTFRKKLRTNEMLPYPGFFFGLTLSQPGGGGGGGHCALPPPKYISSNISRTPWATDLKLSDNLNDLIFNTKIIFQPPPPTLGYHSDVQSWRMFLKTHISSCHAKLPTTRRFWLGSIKSISNGICCGNLGLLFHLTASWCPILFRTLFRA